MHVLSALPWLLLTALSGLLLTTLHGLFITFMMTDFNPIIFFLAMLFSWSMCIVMVHCCLVSRTTGRVCRVAIIQHSCVLLHTAQVNTWPMLCPCWPVYTRDLHQEGEMQLIQPLLLRSPLLLLRPLLMMLPSVLLLLLLLTQTSLVEVNQAIISLVVLDIWK